MKVDRDPAQDFRAVEAHNHKGDAGEHGPESQLVGCILRVYICDVEVDGGVLQGHELLAGFD